MAKKPLLPFSEWHHIFSDILTLFLQNIWKYALIFLSVFIGSFLLISLLSAFGVFPSEESASIFLLIFFLLFIYPLYNILADSILNKHNFFENVKEMFLRYIGGMIVLVFYIAWPVLALLLVYLTGANIGLYLLRDNPQAILDALPLAQDIFLLVALVIIIFRAFKSYLVLPRLLLHREETFLNLTKTILPNNTLLLKVIGLVVAFVIVFYALPVTLFSFFGGSEFAQGAISFFYVNVIFSPLLTLFLMTLTKKIFRTKKHHSRGNFIVV